MWDSAAAVSLRAVDRLLKSRRAARPGTPGHKKNYEPCRGGINDTVAAHFGLTISRLREIVEAPRFMHWYIAWQHMRAMRAATLRRSAAVQHDHMLVPGGLSVDGKLVAS